MNSNTHNAGIKAWRYSVTRADRKDLGKLLAPIARTEQPYTRDTQGRIVFPNGLPMSMALGTRWSFVPR
jgi:hypothetical protein